ncbi:hypothetical protein DPEC_G00192750 [Dallia pectoralis]|uniref:Uncharacterized protein n=1 Tax=Dallia pectoralis TaxID=75939 RepID=A0ACC2GCF9_DALPE|nr:hypothetical protein DPEC_G00192750 [Dallia pectoralis]
MLHTAGMTTSGQKMKDLTAEFKPSLGRKVAESRMPPVPGVPCPGGREPPESASNAGTSPPDIPSESSRSPARASSRDPPNPGLSPVRVS